MSPTRSYQVQTDSSGKRAITIRIRDTPGLVAENLSLGTWGSSFVLANQLHKWTSYIQTSSTQKLPPRIQDGEPKQENFSILELGAGTSLVGLTASILWSPNRVITTDLAALTPGLEQNISLNEPLLSSSSASITCGVLDWTEPTRLQLHVRKAGEKGRGQGEERSPTSKGSSTVLPDPSTKPHTILAADTLYDAPHPALLTSVVRTWLAPGPHSRVILCYPLRHAYIDIIRELWERFEAAGLECVEEGRQDADPDQWDDVAPFEWCLWMWTDAGEARREENGRLH